MSKIIAIQEIYKGNGQGFKNKFGPYKKIHKLILPDFKIVFESAVKAVKI